MVDIVSLGLVAAGIVILLFGAALSIYGVALMGLVIGGGAGYMLSPMVASAAGTEGLAVVAAAVVGGALAGVVITYVLLSMAIAAIGFAVGTYLGLVVVAPMLDEGTLMTIGAAVAVGIAAAFLGMFLKRTTMVVATSFIGAALASRSITPTELQTAQADVTMDPLLFEYTAPVFLGLFALGVLSQTGLFKFGYVTKLVAILPGASVLRDGDEQAS